MQPEPLDADTLIAQAEAIELAVRKAVRDALADHKRAGNPVAICEDGEVRWLSPDEIDPEEAYPFEPE